MSFDPRSLERLKELGRQLPKPLEPPTPSPKPSPNGNTGWRPKRTPRNCFAN